MSNPTKLYSNGPIFGLNFNRQPIPTDLTRRFPKRLRVTRCANCSHKRIERALSNKRPCCDTPAPTPIRGQWGALSGVALSRDAMVMMLIQADNGHRILGVVEKRIGHDYTLYTSPMFVQTVYAIYVY
jgi:hypothetical protein